MATMIGGSTAVQNVRLALARAAECGTRPLEVAASVESSSVGEEDSQHSAAKRNDDSAVVAGIVHSLLELLHLGLLPGASFLRFLGAAAKSIPRAPEIHDLLGLVLEDHNSSNAPSHTTSGAQLLSTSSMLLPMPVKSISLVATASAAVGSSVPSGAPAAPSPYYWNMPIVDREKVYLILSLQSPGSLMRTVARCYKIKDVLRDYYFLESPFFSERFLSEEVQPLLVRVARQRFCKFPAEMGLAALEKFYAAPSDGRREMETMATASRLVCVTESSALSRPSLQAALPAPAAQHSESRTAAEVSVTAMPKALHVVTSSCASSAPATCDASGHSLDDDLTSVKSFATSSRSIGGSTEGSTIVRKKRKSKLFSENATQTQEGSWWNAGKPMRSTATSVAPEVFSAAVQTVEHQLNAGSTSTLNSCSADAHALSLRRWEAELIKKERDLMAKAAQLQDQERALHSKEQILARAALSPSSYSGNRASRGGTSVAADNVTSSGSPRIRVPPSPFGGPLFGTQTTNLTLSASPLRHGRSVSLGMQAAVESMQKQCVMMGPSKPPADDASLVSSSSLTPRDEMTAPMISGAPTPLYPRRGHLTSDCSSGTSPAAHEAVSPLSGQPHQQPSSTTTAEASDDIPNDVSFGDQVGNKEIMRIVAEQGYCCYKCSLPLRREAALLSESTHTRRVESTTSRTNSDASSAASNRDDNDDNETDNFGDGGPNLRHEDVTQKIAAVARAAMTQVQTRVKSAVAAGGAVLRQASGDVTDGALESKGGQNAPPSPPDGAEDGIVAVPLIPVVDRETGYRFCYYSGGIYCRSCMSDDSRSVIPHRLIRNLDVTAYPVSDEALCKLERSRFTMSITTTMLSEEVRTLPIFQAVQGIRRQLRILASVINQQHPTTDVPNGNKNVHLSPSLQKMVSSHYVAANEPYSIADLISLGHHGNDSEVGASMLDVVRDMRDTLVRHCATTCSACRSRSAKSCALCSDRNLIYIFDTQRVVACGPCALLFHKNCAETSQQCTKCRKKFLTLQS